MKKLLFTLFLFAATAVQAQTKPTIIPPYKFRIPVCENGEVKKKDCHEVVETDKEIIAVIFAYDTARDMPIYETVKYDKNDTGIIIKINR